MVSLEGGGILMATTPFNFLTSTVNSRGTLEAFSTALSAARRTRRLLATLLVMLDMTFLSLAPLFFLWWWGTGGWGSDDGLLATVGWREGERFEVHNTLPTGLPRIQLVEPELRT